MNVRERLHLDDALVGQVLGAGQSLLDWMGPLELVPRSITGVGLRQTLEAISREIPLQVTEVPSGTPVFDWVVPQEWALEEAWLEGPDGRRVVDAADNPLHVVSYSTAVDGTFDLADLAGHLHTLPQHPDWIPYKTAYYSPAWGFCLSESVRAGLPPGQYRAVIRTRHFQGSMSFGECLLPGSEPGEVLVFAHCCHPVLANDNLSGLAVATALARTLAQVPHRYTYRIVFAPATIGSITWLALRQDVLPRVRHGLVLSLLGDRGELCYKPTDAGDALIDRAGALVMREGATKGRCLPYSPWGYDERQFNAPGFRLPVGRLTRTPHGEFKEYHTSGDNLAFMAPESLAGSLLACLRIFEVLEGEATYRNLAPFGEPQLGRRGLYSATGGAQTVPDSQMAMLWVLNQSDGARALTDIAARSGLAFRSIRAVADRLVDAGLLEPVSAGSGPAARP